MKEYQAVILRIADRARDDEDALTDLLNERSRAGWEPVLMTQDHQRVTVVFQRQATNDTAS
jgi:SRSO17 transposase